MPLAPEPASEDEKVSSDLQTPELELPVDSPLRVVQRPPSPSPAPGSGNLPVVAPAMERGISIALLSEKMEQQHPWYSHFGRKKFITTRRPELVVVVDADAPAIVLPFPPTDDEKYLYAQTRRLPLYIFGTVSFLSVSVGMWFFSLSAEQFYW